MAETRIIIGGCSGGTVSRLTDRKSRLTTSIGIVMGKRGIVIDHGHGVANVAEFLADQNVTEVLCLQTHLHRDHVEGFMSNSLLFNSHLEHLGIWAPPVEKGLQHVWDFYTDTTSFPINPLTEAGIAHEIRTFGYGDQSLAEYGIETFELWHYDGCAAFKISTDQGDIVIATDHEPGNAGIDRNYAQFVDGAKLLIADIQYRQNEYDGTWGIGNTAALPRIGWGHGTPELLGGSLALCKRPPIKVLMTHHDKARPEKDLLHFMDEAKLVLAKVGVQSTNIAIDGLRILLK